MADSKCSAGMYDVIVVGGGPIGLAAAYQCIKRGKTVLVLEQFNFGNEHGSSAGFSRQFRICYSEKNLSNLAVKASKEWDILMKEVDNYTLMQRTGTLWFGDAGAGGSGSSSEGNIDEAIVNLIELDQEHTEITDKDEIDAKFPFISAAVDDIENPKALFVPDGGTVDVPVVVRCFLDAIGKHSGCKLMQSVRVTCIDYSCEDKILVTTNDNNVYRAEKVILTPGTYVNNVLAALKPEFPKLINFDIFLWVSTYFKIAPRYRPTNRPTKRTTTVESPRPYPTTWPTWYFFGNPKNEEEPIDHNLYYGFPIEQPTPKYARVCPAFISEQTYYYYLFPNHVNNRPLDQHALQFTSKFVQDFMPDLDPSLVNDKETNCVAGFVSRLDGEADNSGGIVLDFVPGTSKRIVVTAGGWCMKYVPVMGIILAELAIEGAAPLYSEDIAPMNIDRGILLDIPRQEIKPKVLSNSQIAAKCRKLWF